MDVREIIISEFIDTFRKHGYRVNRRILEIAESPFDLRSVQSAVDNEIREEYWKSPYAAERPNIVARLEMFHEKQLRSLSRQYALRLMQSNRKGYEISASLALNEQRALKLKANGGCDVYPCEKQQRRGY